MRYFIFTLMIFVFITFFSVRGEEWLVSVSPELRKEPSITFALGDLKMVGERYNLTFKWVSDHQLLRNKNTLIVGNVDRNKYTKTLVEGDKIHITKEILEEGFEIQTIKADTGNTLIIIAGSTVIGEAYGIYWLIDRLQVYQGIPEMNEIRAPAFSVRIASAWGRHLSGGGNEEQLKNSLRYSFNWVSGMNMLDLIPWNSEPENEVNLENCKNMQRWIDLAHDLGMRYFAFSNEVVYHPSLFNYNPNLLNPCNPEFWDTFQDKYRLLFRALPSLDGIEICLDDISGFWDNYKPLDVLHDVSQCTLSYEERYHTLVKKVYEVVVGEFGKTYFHKNWGLRDQEIHCQPEVYKEVFTEDIPKDNLFVMIKITRGDRWWFQQYNPTFNLTPHKTIVIFETMNYYEAGNENLFPTFSGEYFQRGLQYFLSHENSNVVGFSYLGGCSGDEWSTRGAYIYVLYRLLWEPDVSIKEVAKDYCSKYVGAEVANEMAEILMSSAEAYKYGLFIEPIAYGQFNSLLHMRVGIFTAEGYPLIDLGKGHIGFLRTVFMKCDPWRKATFNQLQYGLNVAESMLAKYREIKDKINPPMWKDKIELQLNMTNALIQTNVQYVKTMFHFFDYLDKPNEETRNSLLMSYQGLVDSCDYFKKLPGFSYKLDGVHVLIEHCQRALSDIELERSILREVPSQPELDRIITQQQGLYRDMFEKYKGVAKKIGHFEILVDGQDLLHIKGNRYRIEHLRWDAPYVGRAEFYASLPEKEQIVIPVPIDTRPLHPFVLYQPSNENGYEAVIYLDDRPGGMGWFLFDVYSIDVPKDEDNIIRNWAEYFTKKQ